MFKYTLRRLLMLIPLLVVVSVLVFSTIYLMPGDPAEVIAGEGASQEDIANVRQSLGLDRPLYEQYLSWMARAVHGDFGTSIRTGRPVAQEIGFRFKNTLNLTVFSMLFATIFGLVTGIISAVRRYSVYDNISMVVALIGISITPFYLGLMLMLFFSVRLGWLPLMGLDSWRAWILPAITLGARPLAMIARMTRSSMLEIMGQDYILTARAQGLPEWVIIFKYALKNALNTVITVVGLQFGQQLGGAVITETVFALPGIGRLAVESIKARDFPVVQAAILVVAAAFVLVNLVVDLLYAYVNPRIRYS
ncbi:ABC transporter permease [Gelria sp. Kuro-4]|uniref:ABC transporter permease n=1 Tax=Gelria sp. Kuro-4 TaxID=2796927 RepID=UPI001BEE2F1A|nr:ABC transporter permease [Gelria sp. Kuro-4]BCV23586.1 peptide ABC transporter permease [Gelria sp. Kuro-4]